MSNLPQGMYSEIAFPDDPFVDEPKDEIAVGHNLIDEVDVGWKVDEQLDDDQDKVDGEKEVPEAFTVVERDMVAAFFNRDFLFGIDEGERALNLDKMFSGRDVLHRDFLFLHDAKHLPVEIDLVRQREAHLRGLVGEGQSPIIAENVSVHMAFGGLVRAVEEALVVVLGRVEGHELAYLGGGLVSHLHQLAEDAYGGVAFRGVGKPDGRKVLCPNIDTLSVGLLEVVYLEEEAHQGFVGDNRRVVFNLYGLQMPRLSGFHLLVARPCHFAAHESDGGLCHAFETPEVILDAPKASC